MDGGEEGGYKSEINLTNIFYVYMNIRSIINNLIKLLN